MKSHLLPFLLGGAIALGLGGVAAGGAGVKVDTTGVGGTVASLGFVRAVMSRVFSWLETLQLLFVQSITTGSTLSYQSPTAGSLGTSPLLVT